MKVILRNKRKLEDNETIILNEECSVILLNKLPPKLKDSGSFTIPYTIGNSYFEKVLCDLGASINLMPLSVFRTLGLELKPISISLQLANRSIKYPRGVIEDVLVKVKKLYFSADFIILDMEEDREVPLILGHPFLATNNTLIDMQQGKLTLRVPDKEVTFNIFEAMKYPSNHNECHYIDIIEKVTTEVFENEIPILPLEASLIHSATITEDDFERRERANYLEATSLPKYGRQQI